MNIWFHPSKEIEIILKKVAPDAGIEGDFDPQVRPADPRFGDFQANGILPVAKSLKTNPRALAEKTVAALKASPDFNTDYIDVSIAGPGFVNFKLTPKFLNAWLAKYKGESELKSAASKIFRRQKDGHRLSLA